VRVVLVAAKDVTLAKTRLAHALPSGTERATLAEAMFRDVLDAAVTAHAADRVAVVTSDRILIRIAHDMNAIVLDEVMPQGLNAAVRFATNELTSMGATTICTILSDIPMVTGQDIDAAFAAMPSAHGGVVLVPSRDFSGTNMIVRQPPDVIPTQFGHLSLVRHLDDARSRNLACAIVRLIRPALDLDCPDDLLEFVRTPTMTHTFGHLTRLGLHHD
jgi:2-phospho-L-lactate/phosphoenolpyruvate guanylyltransferase